MLRTVVEAEDCTKEYEEHLSCLSEASENQVVRDDPAADAAEDFCQPAEDSLDACIVP